MSYAEVDQSGKIEQFNLDTVVALSDDKKFSVLLPKKIKQELYIKYRSKIDNLKYKLFTIFLFYCMRGIVSEETKSVICKEYEGNELFIKSELMSLFNRQKILVLSRSITFNIIGKSSSAHKLAICVQRKHALPDMILSFKDVEDLLNA